MIYKSLNNLSILSNRCRQLRILLESGLSIKQSIEILIQSDTHSSIQNITENHLNDVLPIQDILPFVDITQFPSLKDILIDFEQFFEQKQTAIKHVIRMLSYPLTLCVALMLLMLMNIMIVIPSYIDLFNAMDIPLPFWITLTINIQNTIKIYSVELVLVCIIAVCIIHFINRPLMRKLIWNTGVPFKTSDIIWTIQFYLKHGYSQQKAIQSLHIKDKSNVKQTIETIKQLFQENQNIATTLEKVLNLSKIEIECLHHSTNNQQLQKNLAMISRELHERESELFKKKCRYCQWIILMMFSIVLIGILNLSMTPILTFQQ